MINFITVPSVLPTRSSGSPRSSSCTFRSLSSRLP
uniref:RPGRIP1 like n=1 Tax=Rousettus aegyptiacus TaxID=9407 RepID=A0A7J8CL05_ROUAE|nr:RPGRIP1 like [Rousettus aegyptiacus]